MHKLIGKHAIQDHMTNAWHSLTFEYGKNKNKNIYFENIKEFILPQMG